VARVVVIGGGIAGLSCARDISDRLPNADVILLEAGDRAGGCVQTSNEEGFVCDGGPSGFLNSDPSTVALATRLGLENDVITGCESMRRRYILSGGSLRRFPDSPATFFSSDLLSVRSRFRMMLEPLVRSGPRGMDETVAHFARRRLGREAAELLMDPVISGIYAGDPNRLSMRASLPQMAALEDKGLSLVRAIVGARKQGLGEKKGSPSVVGRRRYVSFRGGIGQFARQLEVSLGDAIRYRSPVERVERNGQGWRVYVGGPSSEIIHADVVVSAAPGPAARSYLGHLDESLDQVCEKVPYAPVAMVALGYLEAQVPHPLTGFGYLVPTVEGGSVLGVLWSTSIFPGNRAPQGKVLLQAILGGMRDPDICHESDEKLALRARVQINKAIGINAEPMYQKIFRHPLGIPQYEVGHLQRVSMMERSLLHHPGLFLTGNAFRGIGINSLTADALRIGSQVESFVNALPRNDAPRIISAHAAPLMC